MYNKKLHISVILVRISTSSNSIETFKHWQKPKNEAIYDHADLLVHHANSLIIQ